MFLNERVQCRLGVRGTGSSEDQDPRWLIHLQLMHRSNIKLVVANVAKSNFTSRQVNEAKANGRGDSSPLA